MYIRSSASDQPYLEMLIYVYLLAVGTYTTRWCMLCRADAEYLNRGQSTLLRLSYTRRAAALLFVADCVVRARLVEV